MLQGVFSHHPFHGVLPLPMSVEPPDIELFNPEGRANVLLVCDHAGKRVPSRLGGLGISEAALGRHVGWDIGAADVTYALARRLDCPAVLCHVSRLVIDPTRRPFSPGSIPPVSDGCVVSGNERLGHDEILRRIYDHFQPYHRAIARSLGRFRRAGIVPVLIAVHSFTPRMNGEDRPWQVGVLWRGDQRLSRPVLASLRSQTNFVVGDNQPYSGIADFGITVTFHAQRSRLPHIMFEIRQDQIADRASAVKWAEVLHATLRAPLAEPALYSLYLGHNLAGTGRPLAWRHAGMVAPRA
jgi:predicted N-formylglutamate amidohydrolase